MYERKETGHGSSVVKDKLDNPMKRKPVNFYCLMLNTCSSLYFRFCPSHLSHVGSFCSEQGQHKQDLKKRLSSIAKGENLMCALTGAGSLHCKNVFLGPSGKGLRVRNQASGELKLQPFLGIGVQKVGCSQGGGKGASQCPWKWEGQGTGNMCGRGSFCQDEMLDYEGGVGA